MPTQDTSQIKEKILYFLKTKGPALPVHIARETGQSILFSSAFLSELYSEKKIKISNMKVGSSPVYYIPEQYPRLEKYAEHLKSKEKDAFLLLKEKKFLKDIDQDPAIRVALRAIKDFAMPFENNGELIWRFFTVPISEYFQTKKQEEQKKPTIQKTQTQDPKKENKETIIPEKKELPKTPKTKKTKSAKKSQSQSKQEKFFNKVKETLNKRGIEITGIVGVSSKDLTLKIIKQNTKMLLFAFNKRKITENDIMKAYKKASEEGLSYLILSLSEPTKKMSNFIDAVKSLESLEKIE